MLGRLNLRPLDLAEDPVLTGGEIIDGDDRREVERAVDVGKRPVRDGLPADLRLDPGRVDPKQDQVALPPVELVRHPQDLARKGIVDKCVLVSCTLNRTRKSGNITT